MKNMFKLFFSSLLLFIFSSCEKDENKIYFEGGTPPVLSSNLAATIPLSFANTDKDALRLSWTNPNYQFTTGGSSQDVSYLIEIDTIGANFTNPKKENAGYCKQFKQNYYTRRIE